MNIYKILLIPALLMLLTACSPEIGSEAWCQDMKEKPKADWTANQAADYAKHCFLNSTP